MKAVSSLKLKQNEILSLYFSLYQKNFHETIIYALFPHHKSKFIEYFYESLFYLNEHQKIANEIIRHIKSNHPKVMTHLTAFNRLHKTDKNKVIAVELKKEKNHMSPSIHLLEFYHFLYAENYSKASKKISKITPFLSIKTNHLINHFNQSINQVANRFYKEAHYYEYLNLFSIPSLKLSFNNEKISHALFYLRAFERKQYKTSLAQLELKTEYLMMLQFYSNQYNAVIELSRKKANRMGNNPKNKYLAISLLVEKKWDIYEDVFIKNPGSQKNRDLYKIYQSIYQTNTDELKKILRTSKKLDQDELRLLYLIGKKGMNTEKLLQILKLKLAFSLKMENLYHEEKSLPPILKSYLIVSILENYSRMGKYKECEEFFRISYAELTDQKDQEKSLFYYGKSQEWENPKEAKRIYEKLLLKNPNNYYKHQVITYLNRFP